jgi:AraC family transcriptional activator of tynA and feaB
VVTAGYRRTGSGADQPGAWQALLSDTHLPRRIGVPERRPGDRFEAWARRWWIDDLARVDCECDPCSGSRRRPELAATDGEFVVVLMTPRRAGDGRAERHAGRFARR